MACMVVVFVTRIVSFLPGLGLLGDIVRPWIQNVEDAMSAVNLVGKSLFLTSFSITASEPKAIVLRSFVGKVLSWANQNKLFLHKHRRGNYEPQSNCIEKNPNRVHMIDVSSEEGHRLGTYALWDAFSDLIDKSKIEFLEALGDHMRDWSVDDAKENV